ncbi:hypothetical protein HK405_006628 [Cladochytrium tenue]|nr:hypothetical protein HK405_006628 [Cladochytrium tenue]
MPRIAGFVGVTVLVAVALAVLAAAPAAANVEKAFVRVPAADASAERWTVTSCGTDSVAVKAAACLQPPFASCVLHGNQTVALRGLAPGSLYELRVCWPASTPADYALVTDSSMGTVNVVIAPTGVLPQNTATHGEDYVYELVLEATLLNGLVPAPLSSIRVVAVATVVLAVMLLYLVPSVAKSSWFTAKYEPGTVRTRR